MNRFLFIFFLSSACLASQDDWVDLYRQGAPIVTKTWTEPCVALSFRYDFYEKYKYDLSIKNDAISICEIYINKKICKKCLPIEIRNI